MPPARMKHHYAAFGFCPNVIGDWSHRVGLSVVVANVSDSHAATASLAAPHVGQHPGRVTLRTFAAGSSAIGTK
jgi:hypothetical protein